jgi:hypothetical protein
MMVDDGALKPAPREDELHPASVPVGGATAALISPEVPAAEDEPAGPGAPGPTGGAASTDAPSPVAR